MLRRSLLWLSENPTLRRRVPAWKPARRAAARFVAGDHLEDAVQVVRDLEGRGMGAMVTLLGERVHDQEEAGRVTGEYLRVLAALRQAGSDAGISVKPSHLGLALGEAECAANLERLVSAAQLSGATVWVDMEESELVEPTLALYERARHGGRPVGVCLQAYLRRTASDLTRLMPLSPRIRLVKGAYREPPAIALTRKAEIDAAYRLHAEYLLETAVAGGCMAALATHDVPLLHRTLDSVAGLELRPGAYEIQMLYGIRPADQAELVRSGRPVRILVSYGADWYPWFLRRVAERPSNLLFVLPRGGGRS